mmetsp:Transcript_42292/g.75754  ORF Transcript_42292/g.75754 Transcript_42292/m.75754 type:complete len:222 (+) Transcript_42292:86-751(+)
MAAQQPMLSGASPISAPAPLPMIRAQTAPPPDSSPLASAQVVRPAYASPTFATTGKMSLFHVGDPAKPFAGAVGSTFRAQGTQVRPASSVVRPLQIQVPPGEEVSLVRAVSISQGSMSQGSMSASPASSGLQFAAPSPVNMEHWQVVGRRLANVFQDPSLLSTPSQSPMSSPTGYRVATLSSSTLQSPLASPTFAQPLSNNAFGMPHVAAQATAAQAAPQT